MIVLGTTIAIDEIDPYRCIGCGVCVQSCQNDVIRMKGGKAYRAHLEECSGCTFCIEDCPREAISLGLVSESKKQKGYQTK